MHRYTSISKSIRITNIQIQNPLSVVCSQHCLYFLLHLSRGIRCQQWFINVAGVSRTWRISQRFYWTSIWRQSVCIYLQPNSYCHKLLKHYTKIIAHGDKVIALPYSFDEVYKVAVTFIITNELKADTFIHLCYCGTYRLWQNSVREETLTKDIKKYL